MRVALWSQPTAAASPDWPRMTSVPGSGDEGAEGDRACTIRIRGRATPSWMCLTSRLRYHRGRKARMKIVTDSVASVSLAKVRNSSLPPVVNVNNRRKWFYSLRENVEEKALVSTMACAHERIGSADILAIRERIDILLWA